MPTIGEAIRDRRMAIGESKAGLARKMGEDVRQISRWENSESSIPAEKLLSVARALGTSIGTLAGEMPLGLDMSGKWTAAHQSTRASEDFVNIHELTAVHSGEFVYFDAVASSGAYTTDFAWRADLRVMEESLAGTYRAVADHRRERGVLYFVLARAGDAAIGHWAGQWQDGILGTGYSALARTPNRARRLLDVLIAHPTPIVEWPREMAEDDLQQLADSTYEEMADAHVRR